MKDLFVDPAALALIEGDERIFRRAAAALELARVTIIVDDGAHSDDVIDAHLVGDHLRERLRRRRDDPHVEAARFQRRHQLAHRVVDAHPGGHIFVRADGLRGADGRGRRLGVGQMRERARLFRRLSGEEPRLPRA